MRVTRRSEVTERPAGLAARISVTQLRAFVAVVDHGGFGRAAIELRSSQPAVSAALTGLERQLGGPLLHRHPRVVPTVLGHELLPHARAALTSLGAIAIAAERHVRRWSGVVRLAAPGTACHGLLPGWLATWRTHFPEVTVKVFEADDAEMTSWLDEGVVDAAVLIDPDPCPEGGVVVLRDAYEAVLPKDHPYATEPMISIRDLLDDPVIVSTSGCHGDVMRICREGRSDFEPAHRVRELGALVNMVANHVGVTVMPSLGRALLTPELTMVPITPRVERALVFTGPPARPWNPIVTALRDFLARPM